MTNYELTTKKINKLNSKFVIRNCLFVIVFTFIILAGLFGSAKMIRAEDPPTGSCTLAGASEPIASSLTEIACHQLHDKPGAPAKWQQTTANPSQYSSGTEKPKTDLEKALEEYGCMSGGFSLKGCVLGVVHIFFYSIPAFLLWIVAYVFNDLIFVSLNGDLLKTPFLSEAWTVVRDLSNLFFILVLLYIAIKIILDLGAAEAQKMIARVIIVALLINFSMFFTKVIIDSSNILALVFYNKLEVKNKNNEPIAYSPLWKTSSASSEKNIAGGLVSAFDPTTTLTEQFFKDLTDTYVFADDKNNFAQGLIAGGATALSLPVAGPAAPLVGAGIWYVLEGDEKVPVPLLVGILIVSGSFMYSVASVLFMAAFAFLIRIINLWVLLIFSPFAFMSFAVPFLENKPYIGWSDWLSRLLTASFFAPIFMFFLYFIFMLIQSNLFQGLLVQPVSGPDSAKVIKIILMMILPLLLVTILLYKAQKFALKSSGKAGEWMEKIAIGAAKTAGTAVLAVATEGASLAATSAIGGAASKTLGNKELQERAAHGDISAMRKIQRAERLATTKIDFKSPLKTMKGLTGLGMPSAEGGYKGMVGREAEKYKKESELYKTTKSQAQIDAEAKDAGVKQRKYDTEQEASGLSKEEYAKKNGPRPVVYHTAEQIDNARMKAFQESLGKRWDWGFGKEAGKAKFGKELEKQLSKMKAVEVRITDTIELLKKQNDVMAKGVALGVTKDTKNKDAYDNSIYTIDEKGEERLKELLAKQEIEKQDLDSRLKALNRRIAKKGEDMIDATGKTLKQQKTDLIKEMIDFTKEAGTISALKDIDQTITNTRNQIFNLTGQQTIIKEGGPTPPPPPPPP